jgi:hypothetical protein
MLKFMLSVKRAGAHEAPLCTQLSNRVRITAERHRAPKQLSMPVLLVL